MCLPFLNCITNKNKDSNRVSLSFTGHKGKNYFDLNIINREIFSEKATAFSFKLKRTYSSSHQLPLNRVKGTPSVHSLVSHQWRYIDKTGKTSDTSKINCMPYNKIRYSTVLFMIGNIKYFKHDTRF